MKIEISGRMLPQVEVIRHTICETPMGIAGYAEVKLEDGRTVEIAGKWDDPYKWDGNEEKVASWFERVTLDGTDVTCDEEGGTNIKFGDNLYNTEEIMQAIWHTLNKK